MPSHHPAIITQELFDRVQAVVEKNSGIFGNNDTGTRRIQKLTGMLVCPTCGRKLNCNGRNRVPYWFCPEEGCSLQIEEQTVFKMLKTAIQIRFGDSDDIGDNIRRMYEEIDHLIGQKNQINNELVAAQGRLAALEKQKTMLEFRLMDTNENIHTVILSSITVLEKQIIEEKHNVNILSKKSEKCIEFSKNALHIYEEQKQILLFSENNHSLEKIVDFVVHNNIRGILTKVIINSPAELSVYWLDNSVTKINGGAVHG